REAPGGPPAPPNKDKPPPPPTRPPRRNDRSSPFRRRQRRHCNGKCSRQRGRMRRLRRQPAPPGRLPRSHRRNQARNRRRKSSGTEFNESQKDTGRPRGGPPVLKVLTDQCIITFLNCQGSRLSMSSGKRPGRPVSGVQSVWVPTTGQRWAI